MKQGLIGYFAANPVAANLLMLFLIIGGAVSGANLAVQHAPEIDLRSVTITVRSHGASPREVEEDINRRIEESVVGLEGVARVIATAVRGKGTVRIEMAAFADPDAVFDEVQNVVDEIESFPPPGADRPEVSLDRTSVEVVTLAVTSAAVTGNALRVAAEDLRDAVLELPSVTQVSLEGTREREIAITLSQEELRRHQLSFAEIVSALRRESINLTSGELRTEAGGLVLHIVSKRLSGDDFRDIPLITGLNGSIITLGAVAAIDDGLGDPDVIARVNGIPAIFVRVDAAEQQSIVDIAAEIEAELAGYEPPPGVAVSVWNDRGAPALSRLSEIVRNAVIGMMLVFVCLVLVFDLRVAVWVAVGIPLSFVGSLMFFGPFGLTLNMGTVFGFFLLIGIVVDDAVVVGESIATERARGLGALEAAVAGARAVAGPITIGAVTTILAFLPFLFITAGAYQVLKVLTPVAAFVLVVSLVEAFCILPAHLAHEKPWSRSPLADLQRWAGARLDAVRDGLVGATVSWAVRHVWWTLASGVVLVVAALALVRIEAVRVILLDEQNAASDRVQVDLRLAAGTPIETTLEAAERVADAARAVNEEFGGTAIRAVTVVAGTTASSNLLKRAESPVSSHLASVRASLAETPRRTASIAEIEQAWRRHIGDHSYLESLDFQTARFHVNPDVGYALKHDDPETLQSAVRDLTSFLETVPGVYQVSNSLSLGKRHFEIELTPAGRAAGLTPAYLGAQLRANFHGAVVQRIQRGREEVKVMVRYPAERRKSLRELATERIRRPGGAGEVPLSTVARLTETRELSSRLRIDGRQAALVEARSDAATLTPFQARRLVEREFMPKLLADYPGIRFDPHGNARHEREVRSTLSVLVPLVLIAMYAVMAGFLRSYWKPLVAVAGIPMAFAGAVFSHWVLGWDLTLVSIFGVVAVAGVVVNDGLVLLDRYNAIRREDGAIPAIAAASAATRNRFRAVFLTSLTTVLGLSPLLYERSEELRFLVPFVVSMLGGLVFATVFTLFFLPALVMIADGRRE